MKLHPFYVIEIWAKRLDIHMPTCEITVIEWHPRVPCLLTNHRGTHVIW